MSGSLRVTIRRIDLSGSLVGLNTQPINFGPLGRDLCKLGTGSSFAIVRRAGKTPEVSEDRAEAPRSHR